MKKLFTFLFLLTTLLSLNSNNAGITTARDHSGNNFTGTLNNFGLTAALPTGPQEM